MTKFERYLRRWGCGVVIVTALLSVAFVSIFPDSAQAVAVEPGERFHIRMVNPIENNSGYEVWGSKYYPGDVLSEKMSDYVFRRLKEIPRITSSRVMGSNPEFWMNQGFNAYDMIIKMNLEQFMHKKKDTLGSKVYWDVYVHTYVYNGATGRLMYDSVVREVDNRQYVLYNDMLETGPVYWDRFEQTPYWSAIRKALDTALSEIVQGYNGYRIVGRIVAKAERVDGSLTVSKKSQDKLYHINIGLEDSLKEGDVLAVTRASSVRTISPETPEIHFPQVVGRVRVIRLKGRDAIVEIVKESSEAPIQLGDAVSAPLYGRRDGSSL